MLSGVDVAEVSKPVAAGPPGGLAVLGSAAEGMRISLNRNSAEDNLDRTRCEGAMDARDSPSQLEYRLRLLENMAHMILKEIEDIRRGVGMDKETTPGAASQVASKASLLKPPTSQDADIAAVKDAMSSVSAVYPHRMPGAVDQGDDVTCRSNCITIQADSASTSEVTFSALFGAMAASEDRACSSERGSLSIQIPSESSSPSVEQPVQRSQMVSNISSTHTSGSPCDNHGSCINGTPQPAADRDSALEDSPEGLNTAYTLSPASTFFSPNSPQIWRHSNWRQNAQGTPCQSPEHHKSDAGAIKWHRNAFVLQDADTPLLKSVPECVDKACKFREEHPKMDGGESRQQVEDDDVMPGSSSPQRPPLAQVGDVSSPSGGTVVVDQSSPSSPNISQKMATAFNNHLTRDHEPSRQLSSPQGAPSNLSPVLDKKVLEAANSNMVTEFLSCKGSMTPGTAKQLDPTSFTPSSDPPICPEALASPVVTGQQNVESPDQGSSPQPTSPRACAPDPISGIMSGEGAADANAPPPPSQTSMSEAASVSLTPVACTPVLAEPCRGFVDEDEEMGPAGCGSMMFERGPTPSSLSVSRVTHLSQVSSIFDLTPISSFPMQQLGLDTPGSNMNSGTHSGPTVSSMSLNEAQPGKPGVLEVQETSPLPSKSASESMEQVEKQTTTPNSSNASQSLADLSPLSSVGVSGTPLIYGGLSKNVDVSQKGKEGVDCSGKVASQLQWMNNLAATTPNHGGIAGQGVNQPASSWASSFGGRRQGDAQETDNASEQGSPFGAWHQQRDALREIGTASEQLSPFPDSLDFGATLAHTEPENTPPRGLSPSYDGEDVCLEGQQYPSSSANPRTDSLCLLPPGPVLSPSPLIIPETADTMVSESDCDSCAFLTPVAPGGAVPVDYKQQPLSPLLAPYTVCSAAVRKLAGFDDNMTTLCGAASDASLPFGNPKHAIDSSMDQCSAVKPMEPHALPAGARRSRKLGVPGELEEGSGETNL